MCGGRPWASYLSPLSLDFTICIMGKEGKTDCSSASSDLISEIACAESSVLLGRGRWRRAAWTQAERGHGSQPWQAGFLGV